MEIGRTIISLTEKEEFQNTSAGLSFNELKFIINKREINWLPHMELERITIADYKFLKTLNFSEATFFSAQPIKTVKTLLKLLSVIPDPLLLQYLLIKINETFEKDVSLIGVFHDCATKAKKCLWTPFLKLLKSTDDFIVIISMQILTKLICVGQKNMLKSSQIFYMHLLKSQLIALTSSSTSVLEATVYRSEISNSIAQPTGNHMQKSASCALLPTKSYHFGSQYNLADALATTDEYYSDHFCDNYSSMNTDKQLIKDRVAISSNEYLETLLRCLQMVLRLDEYRELFLSLEGVREIIRILSSAVGFQIQYQLIYCLWILSFNPLIATKMTAANVIQVLSDILSETAKEKVMRITLAYFRNLIEKPMDKHVIKECCITLVQCNVLKYLASLEGKRYDDEDIVIDIEFLTLGLKDALKDLSSFDDFATQIRCRRLEWTPIHKSDKFWHENAERLNEQNFELLRILLDLLKTSKNSTVLCVACFDVGEYVRYYPKGRDIVDKLEFKPVLLKLVSHDDSSVRYEALLSIQKIMVQNWQYLNRQLKQKNIIVNHFVDCE